MAHELGPDPFEAQEPWHGQGPRPRWALHWLDGSVTRPEGFRIVNDATGEVLYESPAEPRKVCHNTYGVDGGPLPPKRRGRGFTKAPHFVVEAVGSLHGGKLRKVKPRKRKRRHR